MAMYRYKDFVDIKFRPSKNHLVALYYAEGKGIPLLKAAEFVSAESSIGTWTELATLTPEIRRKLKPTVFELNKKAKTIKIAYPIDLFENGSIPQVFSSIAGNVFGMKAVNNLRLLDIGFPESFVKSFKGPKFGIKGIRKLLKVKNRPLVGTIIKPKLGLNERRHAEVAFDSWVGGCDVVKDDENLTSMTFNKFDKRIKETLKLRDKAEKETGEKKIYMPNVTAECNEMLRRANYVKSCGGEYAMVDVLTVGFSALQTLRNEGLNLVLHGHRAMHAALTRNKKHGISMLTLAKACRLIGLDQLHIGTIVGKMEGGREEVQALANEMSCQKIKEDKKNFVLPQNWSNLNSTFPVCSGGLHPGHTPDLVKYLGKDIIIQEGGGIHGHPLGTAIGASAARQAIEATMKGIPLKEFAEHHSALKMALEKWM